MLNTQDWMTAGQVETNVTLTIILFIFYSIVGALIEHAHYGVAQLIDPENAPEKAWINPVVTGFPIYGLCALLVLGIYKAVIEPYRLGIVAEFVIYSATITLIELLVGIYVGAGKDSYIDGKVESWDYSKSRFNYDGKIDLYHTLGYGVLGILLVRLTPV